jgi:hypothetical protein
MSTSFKTILLVGVVAAVILGALLLWRFPVLRQKEELRMERLDTRLPEKTP